MGNNIVLLQADSPDIATENDAQQLPVDSQVAITGQELQQLVGGQIESEPTEAGCPSDDRRSIDNGSSLMRRFSHDRKETKGEDTEMFVFPLRSTSFPLPSDSRAFSEVDWLCERRQARRPGGFRSLSEDLIEAQLKKALFCQEAMTSYSGAAEGDIEPLLEIVMIPYKSLFSLLELVKAVADTSATQESIEDRFREVVDILTNLFTAEVATMYLYDSEKQLVAINSVTRGVTKQTAMEVFQDNVCIRGENPYCDSQFSEKQDASAGIIVRNLLCCPIYSIDHQTLGVVQLINKRKGSFSKEDLDILEQCALLCGPVFASTLEREQRKFQNKVDAGIEKCRELVALEVRDSSFSVLLQRMTDQCARALGCEAAHTFFLNEEREDLVGSVENEELRIPRNANCLTAWAFRKGELVVTFPKKHHCYNAQYDFRSLKTRKAAVIDTGDHSSIVIFVPIMTRKGKQIGLLELWKGRAKASAILRRDDVAMRQFASVFAEAAKERQQWAKTQTDKGFCELVLYSTSNGVLTVGNDLIVTKANQAAARLFNTASECEIIGKHISFLFPFNSPSGQEIAGAVERSNLWGERSELLDMPLFSGLKNTSFSEEYFTCEGNTSLTTHGLSSLCGSSHPRPELRQETRSSVGDESEEVDRWKEFVNRANITVIPERGVIHLLQKYSMKWICDRPKLLQKLANDVHQGKCRLEDRCDALVRIVDLVVVRVYLPVASEEGQYVIVQKSIKDEEGRVVAPGLRGLLPATKRSPSEDLWQSAERCLKKKFGHLSHYLEVCKQAPLEYLEECRESPSYEGLLTFYHKTFVDCSLPEKFLHLSIGESFGLHGAATTRLNGMGSVWAKNLVMDSFVIPHPNSSSLAEFRTQVHRGLFGQDVCEVSYEWQTMEDLVKRKVAVTGKAHAASLGISSFFSESNRGSVIVLEDLSKEKIVQSALMRYMDQKVASALLSEGVAKWTLGGKMSKCSILFCDIRNFTSLSESVGPEVTVKLLNEYLAEMVCCVEDFGGTVDKYIGDSIMVVWGSPFVGTEDANNCVQCGIEMQKRVIRYNLARQEREEPEFQVSIGVHTDEVVSGNIGSVRRMNYTVIGDGVNLASRLEGATKQYGVPMIVSDATKRDTTLSVTWRMLDRVAVKGKNETTLIWEPCDREEDFVAKWDKALTLYASRQFEEARRQFLELLAQNDPTDSPCEIYAERCHRFLSAPPSEPWDRVWRLSDK